MSKRDVKPFIDVDVKDIIYRFSHVTSHSVKDILEDLCMNAIKNGIGEDLSPYFKRGIQVDGVIYQGSKNAIEFTYQSKNIERVSMQLNPTAYDYVYNLSYAMECSVAKIVSFTIEKSIGDFKFMERYAKQFLNKLVDDKRKEQLLKVVKEVNRINDQEEYTLMSLLLYIADEYKRFDDGVASVLEDAGVQEGV